MRVERRALFIGLMGPAIQACGFLWEIAHIVISHWSEPLSARHLLYEPAILVIFVGFMLTLLCVPVSLDVVRAKEADVAIPVFEPETQVAPGALERIDN